MRETHVQQKSGFVLLPELNKQSATDYITLVDKNGLLHIVSRPKGRSISIAPLRLATLLVLLVTLFKAVALLNVGVVDYEARLAALSGGNVFEQAGSFVLQVDPVTHAIFAIIGPLLT